MDRVSKLGMAMKREVKEANKSLIDKKGEMDRVSKVGRNGHEE